MLPGTDRPATPRRRVLFFAEAVTLAHAARPIVLANSLAGLNYNMVMACDDRYQRFMTDQPWKTLPLHSISSQRFLRSLARGTPVYDRATLRRYVAEDIALIERVKPDLIVGDFRLSLGVSARLVGIPYATITNAYWSPYSRDRSFPLPVLPFTRCLPLSMAQTLFDSVRQRAFGLHCRALNQTRAEYGFSSFGRDLRLAYTDADYTLYADAPVMFPLEPLPPHHLFLGPILWSPPVPAPDWWHALPSEQAIVYVTLGSSGSSRLMRMVMDSLADQPVTVIASTAGAPIPRTLARNVHVAHYLPGTEAAARASLVICNGGSPTSQQALACGVPVLGIASNMDQFMNMAAVVRAGAGEVMRADRVSAHSIRATVTRMLTDSDCRTQARGLARSFGEVDSGRTFRDFVGRIFGEGRADIPVARKKGGE